MKQVTQSDRLVAADRLGLPTYNPRFLPTTLGPVFFERARMSDPDFTRIGIECADDPYDLPVIEWSEP